MKILFPKGAHHIRYNALLFNLPHLHCYTYSPGLPWPKFTLDQRYAIVALDPVVHNGVAEEKCLCSFKVFLDNMKCC